MVVIGADEGLKLDEFRASVQKLVNERFGEKYGDLYAKIKAIA